MIFQYGTQINERNELSCVKSKALGIYETRKNAWIKFHGIGKRWKMYKIFLL
jgi:hypothetical protein